jgi:hypothetical protein
MMIGKGVEDIDVRIPKDAYDTGKQIPTFNAYLTVVVRDSEGRVVKVHRQKSHSPTANFIGFLLPLQYFLNCGCSYSIKNTGGSTISYRPSIKCNGVAISYPNSSNNYPSYLVMIQVGSGSQSNPFSAYSLASPIANGSGTGQLVYGQPSVSSNITVSGSEAYFTISQTFNNSSGATITITEVGIIVNIVAPAAFNSNCNNATGVAMYNTYGQVLMWYDVLSSAISVANGGSVTIYYTFTVNP